MANGVTYGKEHGGNSNLCYAEFNGTFRAADPDYISCFLNKGGSESDGNQHLICAFNIQYYIDTNNIIAKLK